MYATTCMNAVSQKPVTAPAKQRLLEAAARVFSRHGFEGATTREIAQEAEVNEVTLFRLFQNKENLQAAVLQRVFDQQAEFLAAQPRHAPSGGLHADLMRIGQSYQAALEQNLSMVRTLLGESHRLGEHEKQSLHCIFDPLRAELLATLEAARDAGLLRPELDLSIAVSMLPAMILTDTLRRGLGPAKVPAYPADEHLAACLDVFIRGISASANS